MNYTQLPQLVDEYGSRGLKILAFPCNQFGGQEPGSPEEILAFVAKYDKEMAKKLVFFEKADVNGANTREVYSYLKKTCPNEDGTADIRWNFAKFLVDHEGNAVKRSTNSPFEMKDDIEALLKKKESSA
jgi:glutathione peroxidase-family protein